MPHAPHGAFDRMSGMGYGPRPGFRMMGDGPRPGFGPESGGLRPGFGGDFSGKPEFGGCGPRPGCHGPHHKGEGARLQMPRSITEDPRYAEMNEDARLAAVLGELGRVEQFMFNRRGGQGRILRLLKENGDMSQRELTFRLGIMPGSASEILAKLEGRGFITRTPDERDRRTALVHLTEEGAAHEAEHAARREARLAAMFSSLTEDEKREYLALSEKLTAAWHQKKNAD